MNEGDQILVAGGGIGGLTAAIALMEHGLSVRVFEQAPHLEEVGAGVSLWPNAMRVFRRLGMMGEVKGRRASLNAIAIRRSDGAPLLHLTASGRQPEPAICLHRADLQEILVGRLPHGVLHLDHQVTGFEERGGGVRVRFAGGGSAGGRLLIGCDGIHSTVRARIHGSSVPAYRGYEIWRGVSETVPPGELQGQATEWWGPGHRFGLLPGEPGRAYWYATRTTAEPGRDGREGLEFLRSHFSSWHGAVGDLLLHASEPPVRTRAEDRPVPRTWGAGAVTLLGDAAHPMTPNMGQGSCAAIEDALVLARSIDSLGPTPEALRLYERLRTRRTAWIVRQSRRIGVLGQLQSPVLVRARDQGLRLLPSRVLEWGQRWIYDYKADQAGVA